ncbi:hypothetical protein WSK_4049 [Novosphingobium sp. Rr 2-17]|uniref:nuclear transport factor 2 family protein n=1 Tax=Novosphingobium sp. Rr 2-17 TaxID=555793 RepID=UPI0002699C1C|nr:nuclear transport factor 2 family protein [Novosphingobium sp. Rr 2-17]EIZ77387.1 hypothetical protein WSK_4049 [Novosphingobium sp. Rr 2-17]
MKNIFAWASALTLVLLSSSSLAGVPPEPASDQLQLLRSSDARLAMNKKLVYDAIRIVMISGHVDRVSEFFAPDYIQHNPGIASGRDAFTAFMKKLNPVPKPVGAQANWPIVTIMAERDLVTVAMIRELPDPGNPDRTVQTTWFDMYRVRNGKIVEHWDGSAGESARPPKKR